MKKRFAEVLFVALVATMLLGCGETNEDTTKTENETTATEEVASDNNKEDYNYSELVTLGEYKGIEITVEAPTVDESYVEQYLKNMVESYMTEEVGVKDRAVENGDKVYLSYEGKVDGVAFDGGTSSGYLLEIGSGTFIPGFEEGLIGAMPGDTVDVNVTFPEVYTNNPDLAGVDAVFTCEIFYIMPEISDEVVAALNMGYSTVDEMKEGVREYLLSDAQSNADVEAQNQILDVVMGNATFAEIPEQLVTDYKESVVYSINNYASYYGLDADTFCTYAYGTDAETAIETLALDYAKQEILFKAIAIAENMTIDDATLDQRMADYATESGYESAEDLLSTGMSKEDYRDYFIFDDVINMIIENAKITQK